MEKQIKKIEKQLDKVEIWIASCIEWKYTNNWLILEYLSKREKTLQATKKKLLKINSDMLINFWY